MGVYWFEVCKFNEWCPLFLTEQPKYYADRRSLFWFQLITFQIKLSWNMNEIISLQAKEKSNQFLFFLVSIKERRTFGQWTCSYSLVSLRICNGHKQTNKQKFLITFSNNRKEEQKKYVKIEGEKEAIHGEKDVENWQFI